MSGRTIWKYDLLKVDHQLIHMPEGAEILSVGVQMNKPVIWVLCDPDAPFVHRAFDSFITGQPDVTPKGPFIGTYQVDVLFSPFVVHVYEGEVDDPCFRTSI